MSFTLFLLHSCCKKTETPDYSALIVGKWNCNSFKKEGVDTVENRKPYSLSGFYENAWWFSDDEQVKYRLRPADWFSFKKDSYVLVENKELTINSETVNGDFSTYNFTITELTANKLTVYSPLWKATWYLIKE